MSTTDNVDGQSSSADGPAVTDTLAAQARFTAPLPASPLPAAAGPAEDLPTGGGSYVRDAETGALKRLSGTNPAGDRAVTDPTTDTAQE